MSITYNNGDICLGEEVLCRSYGPTPTSAVSDARIKVKPSVGVHYKITQALHGTLLKLFMIPKELADGNEWFMNGEKAYYLSTSRYINGHRLNWKSKRNFGDLLLEIVTKEQITSLNPEYAYTLFLRHNDNNILNVEHENYVEISCIWDRTTGLFLEEFTVPFGFRSQTVVHECKETTGNFDEDDNDLVIFDEEGLEIRPLVPLLVTFYRGDHLVTLKFEDIYMNNLISIRSLNNNVEYAFVIGYWLNYPGLEDYFQHFGMTDAFWKKYNVSLYRFNNALTERYNGKFYTFPRAIYKSGMERHIEKASQYNLQEFLNKGFEILASSVSNYSNRNSVIYEFMNYF